MVCPGTIKPGMELEKELEEGKIWKESRNRSIVLPVNHLRVAERSIPFHRRAGTMH